MGFNAADAVSELDWDFTKYGGGSGIVPEPSEEMVLRFQHRLQEIARVGQEGVEPDRAVRATNKRKRRPTFSEALDYLRSLGDPDEGDEEAKRVSDLIVDVVAEACGDKPSAEQIKKLPHRPRQAFYGWIVGQLTDPKAWMPDTSVTPPASFAGTNAAVSTIGSRAG
jgi:hypothetical protein